MRFSRLALCYETLFGTDVFLQNSQLGASYGSCAIMLRGVVQGGVLILENRVKLAVILYKNFPRPGAGASVSGLMVPWDTG